MVKDKSETDPKPQRSHAGCTRCKRRRQKCDEQKPHCGRCIEAQSSCEYSVKLKWGGRKFDRSRFGECLQGVMKVENQMQGFVYASSGNKAFDTEGLDIPPAGFDPFPSLSVVEKSLLHHFTNEASRVTCCQSHIQTELCQMIMTMSMDSRSLMYATLAWAAVHRLSSRGNIDMVLSPEKLIAGFKEKSIRHLRQELQHPALAHTDAQLATIRTLCQYEIHSGSDSSSSWRVHVKGATALMGVIEKSRNPRRTQPRLLYRWYSTLHSLATLAPYAYARAAPGGTPGDTNEEDLEEVYLDDYNGLSTDLSFILGQIGAAAEARRGSVDDDHWESTAVIFEQSIYQIMERDNTSAPRFYPGVAEKLSAQAVVEYSLCNEAYQHTALIHIQRRLRNTPSSTPQIQGSVKRIIECASGITPTHGLSPAIVMTTPLFTAGCEALGEDRALVKKQLTQLYDMLKIRNIGLTIQVLEAYWADESENRDCEELLRRKNWDFIPY